VTEPCLHLGEVGIVVKGIGGRGRSHRVGFRLETKDGRILSDEPVNAIRRDGIFQTAAGSTISKWAKQGASFLMSMSRHIQIIVDKIGGELMQWDETNFLALSFDL
jgi:hypothetical protein